MRSTLRLIAMTVGMALLASCDRTPTTPERVPGPAPVATVTIVRLEITAPASIEPGASAQLKLTAVKSDGTREDVTARAQWFSSDTGVVQVSAAGVMTGAARGETTVRGAYIGRDAATGVMVLPGGTFKLSGRITDSDTPLANVRIEILNGIGEGQTAVTSDSGAYAIYGVAGDVRLQAKREGYRNQIQEVSVSGPHTLDLAMAFEGTRLNLAGPYSLTITAACPAGSLFPESARIRAYDAQIEQRGPGLTVRLSGAPLIVSNGHGDHFAGTLEGNRATFSIGERDDFYYDGHFDLVERFSATQALTISGFADATSGAEGISGALNGMFRLVNRTQPPFSPAAISCYSPAHRFEMRRR